MMPKVNPMDPKLIEAWNKGRKAGYAEAEQTLAKFISDKMQSLTELEGIGEKTAWKIQEHFLKGMVEHGSAIDRN